MMDAPDRMASRVSDDRIRIDALCHSHVRHSSRPPEGGRHSRLRAMRHARPAILDRVPDLGLGRVPFATSKSSAVRWRQFRWPVKSDALRTMAPSVLRIYPLARAALFPLLGRSTPRAGLVALRQTFVRRCHQPIASATVLGPYKGNGRLRQLLQAAYRCTAHPGEGRFLPY